MAPSSGTIPTGKERAMLEIILYVAIGATIGTITGNLIVWAQAEQIREDPAEYVARKYRIRGDADESGKTEQAQEE